jgi:glycosyltransferase involved in cell wall biosynthesis
MVSCATMTANGEKAGKLLVITPAFNEEENIASVAAEVRSVLPVADHLVVDDCSTDRTAGAARQAGAMVISLPVNLGIGGAVQTGFLYAAKMGYGYTAQVDADGQHDPTDTARMLEIVARGEVDAVVGSRFKNGAEGYGLVFRRVGIAILSRAVSASCGMKFTDVTSGLRVYNRRATLFLAENYTLNYPEPESLLNLSGAGFRIAEHTSASRPRRGGRSSITPLLGISYMAKVMIGSLAHAMGRIR